MPIDETAGEKTIYLIAQIASLFALLSAGVVFVVTIKGDIRETSAVLSGQINAIDERTRQAEHKAIHIEAQLEELEAIIMEHRLNHVDFKRQ